MLKTVRDLFRYNLEFALGAILILIVFSFAAASFFSPYPPMDSYVVAPDVPPSQPCDAEVNGKLIEAF